MMLKKNKDSYVILKKDLSSISKLEKEIKMQRKNLLSQQESLKIEEKTKKELYEVSIRKKVIDKVEISLAKKKMEAKKILSKKNITDFDLEKLKKIIIYSKKKSMLVISSLNKDIYNEKDITLILNELFNSMNVKGYVSINDKLTIDGNALINIYDILTFFVDNYYKNSIMVFIFKDKNIKIKIVIDSLKFNKSKFDFDISNIVVKKYSEDSEILITMKENL